jgi:DNA-binding Lrp family transcriptional regulator
MHQVSATASVIPMSSPSVHKSPARLDQIGKRVLRSLADHVEVDVAAVARDLGAAEQVVRERLRSMRESGLVQGFTVRLDSRQLGECFEFLVTGAPTERTDKAALARLCADPQVTRAFGLASAHSVAFTVVGRDLAEARAHGMALAAQAGLRQPQAAMVIATFHDRANGVAPAFADAAPAAPVVAAPVAEPVPAVALLSAVQATEAAVAA